MEPSQFPSSPQPQLVNNVTVAAVPLHNIETTSSISIKLPHLTLIDYIKAEKEHLQKFIQDTRNLYDHILSQKQRFCHHLGEFYQRSQSRKFLFASRVVQLQSMMGYLELEEKIVDEYFQILESFHEALEVLSTSTLNDGGLLYGYDYEAQKMPNMLTVQLFAHDLLDRLVGLQSRLIETLIIPLDFMEKEFQQCIFSDLAEVTCWQQDLQMYGYDMY